jgi:hypothetical protein
MFVLRADAIAALIPITLVALAQLTPPDPTRPPPVDGKQAPVVNPSSAQPPALPAPISRGSPDVEAAIAAADRQFADAIQLALANLIEAELALDRAESELKTARQDKSQSRDLLERAAKKRLDLAKTRVAGARSRVKRMESGEPDFEVRVPRGDDKTSVLVAIPQKSPFAIYVHQVDADGTGLLAVVPADQALIAEPTPTARFEGWDLRRVAKGDRVRIDGVALIHVREGELPRVLRYERFAEDPLYVAAKKRRAADFMRVRDEVFARERSRLSRPTPVD